MSVLGLVVIAAWVVVVTATFNVVLSHRLAHERDVVVRTRATSAAATVIVDAAGHVSAPDHDGDEALDSGIWVYSGSTSVERPVGGSSLQRVADSLATGRAHYTVHGDYRLYVLPVTSKGRRVGAIVASISSVPYRHAQQEALMGSALVALLVLLGAYPVLRLAAKRALRPMDEMTRQADDWSARSLTERFGSDQRFREVQILAGTLDGVLDRLSAVVRHERNLSAELSHELRTPLSRIVAETDLLLARAHSAEELELAHRAVRDTALAMNRIIETLLTAARLDIVSAPGRCVVRTVLEHLVHDSAGTDAPHTTVLDVPADLRVGVDCGIAERILAPVFDNAGRYARAVITVSARRTPDSVEIDIADDGPGIATDLREAVFEPGFRAAPGDGHDGAGLGLALARRLARAAGGDVTVADPRSRLRVRLPPG